MSTVGQRERITQNRVVKLFQEQLSYTHLGTWEARTNNRNIEAELLSQWLKQQGVSDILGNGLHLLIAANQIWRLNS